MKVLTCRWHTETLAVGLLPAGAEVQVSPDSPIRGELVTAAGRTVVFPHRNAGDLVPEARVEGPFRALEVVGPLEFSLTGVLTALLGPLAEAEISIFTLSTFDTDWILVPAGDTGAATRALNAAGHTVITEEQQ
ncbi:ACT domain-containing protein [Parasphingorhabdus pacifica]